MIRRSSAIYSGLVVAAAVLGIGGCIPPQPAPRPTPVVPTPTPQPTPTPADLTVDFADVTAILATARDREARRDYARGWAALAYAVDRAERVGQPVKSTGDLRSLIQRWEPLAWKSTRVEGFCPGVSAAVNVGLIAALGNDERDLKPGEAAFVLGKLAEACQ